MNAKSILAKLKNGKRFEIIVCVIAVVAMLAIYISTIVPKKAKTTTTDATADYCTRMRDELTDAVSALKGAGKTKVIINWESGVEAVIAYITSTGGSTTTNTPQIVTGPNGTKPIVLKEIYPKALGAIIICEGGDNVRVKLDIINAVSVLLSLAPESICVYPMASKN